MLKKFVLNVLSSFVGAWLAILLCIVGVVIFLLGMLGSMISGETPRLTNHSVLKLYIGGTIIEAETAQQFDYRMLVSGKIEKPQTLKGLLSAIQNAKLNSKIDAILLECGGVDASPATLDALRNGIKDFKSSGKRVFAYGDYYSMGDYYVSTVADEVYLNPAGSLNLQGLSGTSLYFKDLLDKVGIDVQTVRVGSFKSAVEPFTSNDMSEPARLQLDSLYNEMWGYILQGISTERKIDTSVINSLVNNYLFLDEANVVKENKLVDDCLYYRQVEQTIAEYVGKDTEDLNFVSPDLLLGNHNENSNADNQIAILYADGEIGEFEGAGINCHKLVPLIVHLAEEENIKGMVLRVNSPGGSVFGSDQIGEALDYFQSKGKPLAVSMGDYAASGGYWISAGADQIFADPLTITGSIGIFGMVPNVNKLVSNIGVHPQTVSTNSNAVFPSIFYPMGEEQYNALQRNVERGYEKFVNRVAKGRNKSVEYIKSIAEGRVWSAIKAQELGLVDKLGGLNDAVNWVSVKTNVSSPNIVSYPLSEYTFWNLLSSSSIVDNAEVQSIINGLASKGFDEKMIDLAGWFLMLNHLQARSPYYLLTLK